MLLRPEIVMKLVYALLKVAPFLAHLNFVLNKEERPRWVAPISASLSWVGTAYPRRPSALACGAFGASRGDLHTKMQIGFGSNF